MCELKYLGPARKQNEEKLDIRPIIILLSLFLKQSLGVSYVQLILINCLLGTESKH